MKKLFLVLSLVTVSLCGARLASAGLKRLNPLSYVISSRYAYGDLGSIRASADGNARLGCEVYNWLNSAPQASCWVYDSANNYGSCNTTNPAMVTAAAAIKGDSGVFISWDANYNCTTIDSYTDSAAMPKVN